MIVKKNKGNIFQKFVFLQQRISHQNKCDGESKVPVVIDAVGDSQVVKVEGDRHVHGLEKVESHCQMFSLSFLRVKLSFHSHFLNIVKNNNAIKYETIIF